MTKALIIIIIFSFSFPLEIPSHSEKEKWSILSETDKIWVATLNSDGIDWARSEAVLPYPIENVQRLIENKLNYPNVFKRLTQVYEYDNNLVHVVLDMPFPISNRDYIVKYSTQDIDNGIRFQFFANEYDNAKNIRGCIRLVNAAGEWNLVAKNDSTLLTYTWNGELLGDFPNFMLETAWKKQGTEVMGWLMESLSKGN